MAERSSGTPASRSTRQQTRRSTPTRTSDALFVFAFSAFHVALFVLVPILLVVTLGDVGALGDLLSGLRTSLGLGLYLWLWGVTWWTHRRWFAGVDFGSVRRALLVGLKCGAVTGVGFFLGVVAVLAIQNPFAAFVAVLGLVGSVLSLLVGGIVGVLLACLDLLLYRTAGRFAPEVPDGAPPASTDGAEPTSTPRD